MRDFRLYKDAKSASKQAASSKLPNTNTKQEVKEKKKKGDWPVLSARVPPDLRARLYRLYPNRGDLSEIVIKLLQGHIIQQNA